MEQYRVVPHENRGKDLGCTISESRSYKNHGPVQDLTTRKLGGSGYTPSCKLQAVKHLEPDILECKVSWPLGSITMSKASGGDGFPVELFKS